MMISSSALPVESRPLLSVGEYNYDDDDDDIDNMTVPAALTSSASAAPPLAARPDAAEAFSVDWMTVARHSLADVTRALPDARSSEMRVKSCDGAITDLERARAADVSESPQLNRKLYKLPEEQPSAGTEVGRVRATLEVIASRIRDAISRDVRQRLARLPEQMTKLQQQKQQDGSEEQEHQEEEATVLVADASCEADLGDRELERQHAAQLQAVHRSHERQALQREQEHRDRGDVESFLKSEILARHAIEREHSDELLHSVAEFLRVFERQAASSSDEAAAEQKRRQEQQHQQTLEHCVDYEQQLRDMTAELEASERRFLADSFATERDAVADAEQQRADGAESAADEARRRRLRSQERDADAQREQEQLVEDFERHARGLIAEWEADTRAALLASRDGESAAAKDAVDRCDKEGAKQLLRCSFFETWRCWALKRREENLRADRERHARIMQYALELQHSQLNGSLDSLYPATTYAGDSSFQQHNASTASTVAMPVKHNQHHHQQRGASPAPSNNHLYDFQFRGDSVRSHSPGVSPVPHTTVL